MPKKEYPVWELFYTYDTLSDQPPFTKTNRFLIGAPNAKAAFVIADRRFSSSKYKQDLLESKQVQKQATLYQKQISLEVISDLSHFSLIPKLSSNGKSLEFIVKKDD